MRRAEVTRVLNERLAGLTLREIRASARRAAARRADASPEAEELLNIFVQEGEQLFDAALPSATRASCSGRRRVLAEQPEFAARDNLRRLLALTEEPRAARRRAARRRSGDELPACRITIGDEHGDPRLDHFTVVTAEYHAGALTGVIGVIGPTRMPYEKVIALVQHTSRLLSDLL